MIDWKERYMREVEGLNNEGDPIGGNPPSGLRHQVEALKAENAAQEKRIYELEQEKYVRDLVVTSLNQVVDAQVDSLENHLHTTSLNRKFINEIESLRKQVEALGHKAPTTSGFCSRDGGCVCGGDLPRIRESCSSWVKPASKNGE